MTDITHTADMMHMYRQIKARQGRVRWWVRVKRYLFNA
jgi:hypothetical protein